MLTKRHRRLIGIFNTFESVRIRGARPADNLTTLHNGLQRIIDEHIQAATPSLQSKESRNALTERLRLDGQVTVSAIAEALFSSSYDRGLVQDLVVSLGERLSCLSMVAILQDLVRNTQVPRFLALTETLNRMSKQNMSTCRLSLHDTLLPQPRTTCTPNCHS